MACPSFEELEYSFSELDHLLDCGDDFPSGDPEDFWEYVESFLDPEQEEKQNEPVICGIAAKKAAKGRLSPRLKHKLVRSINTQPRVGTRVRTLSPKAQQQEEETQEKEKRRAESKKRRNEKISNIRKLDPLFTLGQPNGI